MENRCPTCSGWMSWETRDDAARYGGRVRVFRVTGWWCSRCGENILEGDELTRAFQQHAALRAEVEAARR